jgi:hypothetical protein
MRLRDSLVFRTQKSGSEWPQCRQSSYSIGTLNSSICEEKQEGREGGKQTMERKRESNKADERNNEIWKGKKKITAATHFNYFFFHDKYPVSGQGMDSQGNDLTNNV